MANATKPPERIYLQWYGEDVPDDPHAPVDTGEVTWASEQIWDSDFEYVLVRRRRERRTGA